MERKLYKTKLCILYQRGRCSRQTCSFAHGDAELRRFPGGPGGSAADGGPFTGRREYRGSDLRDKLERRYSPYQRFSPGRDTRGHRMFRNRKQPSHDRGYSPSRSPARKSERRNEIRKKVDEQSDVSVSPRNSDGDQGRFRDVKKPSCKERDLLDDKLREAEMDIQFLEDNRNQLKIILGEKDEEASKLSTKIEELNSQLKNERNDCRRLISKNKKFIKALGRYLRAQEELKRSQSRLQRVADQLDPDILKPGVNEEGSSANVISDGELNQVGSRRDQKNHASPIKKRSRFSTSEDSKPGISKSLDKNMDFPSRNERLFAPSENSEKENDTANLVLVRHEMHKPRSHDYQQKTRRSSFSGSDKSKTFNMGAPLPATSMAAQAVEELIEEIEMEEKSGALEAAPAYQNGSGDARVGNPLPPPPPLPKIIPNINNQYEGDDEDVDVEVVGGDAEMNSEVDIEK